MAFRRRVVRRRVPVRARRGIFRRRRPVYRRRRVGRRRRATDSYLCRAKYSYTQTITPSSGSSVQFYPKVDDFAEFVALKSAFEAYRFESFTVHIRPLFNVAGQTESCPIYAVAPYHNKLTQALDINSVQSLNNSKIYNGTGSAVRSFVPSVLGAVTYINSSSIGDWTGSKTTWRPRLEIDEKSTVVPHYCCVVVWDKTTQPNMSQAVTNRQYEITCSAKIRLYTQKGVFY